ncbi:MAG: DnaJ domain-containing protein [Chloroflexi bacterium]|nr:DnaJ domain-containing protein [Chloroflexota bacterium]
MAEPRRHEPVDLYELLEVSPRASADVIQAAYRVLVRSHHPDVNATAEGAQRTRELNAAYQVLSDPQRRARYDLELARSRRSERMVQPISRRAPTRVLPAHPVRSDPSLHPRAAVFNGHVLISMLLVAAVFTILLVFVWLSVDGAEPPPPSYAARHVELGSP